ncbi:hypothetical protein [Collinsella aerofaciens]|uniref:hypothetical protein n=1 Tax=Collinsella aerofaciens TaxID=74426 RepID=UPI00232FFABA|nr:hypothetical protein [Collinsella aerofaciens]
MYGPALEFEEIGEEVKDEVRRQVIDKIVERVRASSRPVTSAKTIRFGVAGIKNTFVELRKGWIPAREWSTD